MITIALNENLSGKEIYDIISKVLCDERVL